MPTKELLRAIRATESLRSPCLSADADEMQLAAVKKAAIILLELIPPDERHYAVRQFSVTPVVKAVALKDDGEGGFLVLLSQLGPDEPKAGYWRVPSIVLGVGETIAEAMARLLEEERLGTLSSATHIETVESPYCEGGHWLGLVYLITPDQEPAERPTLRWFPASECIEPILAHDRNYTLPAATAWARLAK